MSATRPSKTALELLTLWFEEEFAKGRCDAWKRFFDEGVTVTTARGEVLATLADWCAAYARNVNDRPLVGVTVTASFGEGPEKVALFWEAQDDTGTIVRGAFLAECKTGRIAKLLCLEGAVGNEAPAQDDGALPDRNWWF